MAKKGNYAKKNKNTQNKVNTQRSGTAGKPQNKSATGKTKAVGMKQVEKPVPLLYMLPLILVFAVVPLVTLYKQYNTNLADFEWFTPSSEGPDFFLYYKMCLLIAIGIYILVAIIARCVFYEEKFVWEKTLIPLAVYCVLVILSTVFSPYKEYSLGGSFEQYEPVWVLVTYCLITYYCYMTINTEKKTKTIMKWVVAGVTVMCFIGLSQVIKQDFFRTDLGQELITGPGYDVATQGKLLFNFELGRVYATLYNPNYVGSYVVLFVPVLLVLIMQAKNWKHRLGYAAVAASLLACLFGSQSRAGIVGIVISLLCFAIMERRTLIKNWKMSLGALVLLIIAFVGVDTLNGHVLSSRLKELTVASPKEYYTLQDIYTNPEDVVVVYNGNELHITWNLDEASGSYMYAFTDQDGNAVVPSIDESGVVTLNDERFPFSLNNVAIIEGVNGFCINIDGQPWYFTNEYREDGSYCIYSTTGRFMNLSHPEGTPYLEEHYHAFNMRGYIWSKTIPLLKKYFFLGSGADTFIIAFPNDDLVGMYNSGHVNEIISRPHCWYLQMGVTTGVVSLIAFLVFYLMYVIGSIRIYWKKKTEGYLPRMGIAILCASIGYMVVGVINDSIVCVAPLYWGFLGIGLAINAKLRKEIKEEAALRTASEE